RNIALSYAALSAGERVVVAELLNGARLAGRADAMPARALILKALGARRSILAGATARGARQRAIHAIVDLARGIQGLEPGDLLRRTSLIDIDETIDTESFDPLSLGDQPGAPADRPLGATGRDNDGLFQRYEMSCGPASIEVLLGERDPAYAWRR